MKQVFDKLYMNQAAVLWISLALLVASSAYALLQAFSQLR